MGTLGRPPGSKNRKPYVRVRPAGRPPRKHVPEPKQHIPDVCGCGDRAAACVWNPEATEVTPRVKRCSYCKGVMLRVADPNHLPNRNESIYCSLACKRRRKADIKLEANRRRRQFWKDFPRQSPGPSKDREGDAS